MPQHAHSRPAPNPALHLSPPGRQPLAPSVCVVPSLRSIAVLAAAPQFNVLGPGRPASLATRGGRPSTLGLSRLWPRADRRLGLAIPTRGVSHCQARRHRAAGRGIHAPLLFFSVPAYTAGRIGHRALCPLRPRLLLGLGPVLASMLRSGLSARIPARVVAPPRLACPRYGTANRSLTSLAASLRSERRPRAAATPPAAENGNSPGAPTTLAAPPFVLWMTCRLRRPRCCNEVPRPPLPWRISGEILDAPPATAHNAGMPPPLMTCPRCGTKHAGQELSPGAFSATCEECSKKIAVAAKRSAKERSGATAKPGKKHARSSSPTA
jgi:hypothetical protein